MTSPQLKSPALQSPGSSVNDGEGQGSPSISIVIPAYCEEGNLLRLYEELMQVLGEMGMTWEVVIVDDGSTDQTWSEICMLHLRDKRVKGLKLSRNFGHQYALLSGLANARGDAVITMDADLQHPPNIIPALVSEWRRGNKIVHTVRSDHRNISWMKKITSSMFYRVFGVLSGVEVSRGMADYRLLDRQVVNSLLQLREGGVFLRGLVQWVGYPSVKVEFRARERCAGETKYTFLRMLKFGWTAITSFSIVPLRIAILIGILTSAFAFYQLADALYAKLILRQTVPGWTSLYGMMSLLFGILFLFLGIVGEYMGRILEEVRGRPRYLIDNQIGLEKVNTADRRIASLPSAAVLPPTIKMTGHKGS